jgi:hypothetical protein
MTIRKHTQAMLLAAASLVAAGLVGVRAQQAAPANVPQPASLTQAMPVDPDHAGTFPNGLRATTCF